MLENIIKRNFIIGDEWLYYKIYVGPKSSDFILTNVILPITCKLTDENVIDKWFFIRYNDPDLHLRVRFHLTDVKELLKVISFFNKKISPFIDERIVTRIQVDTYKREIERYNEKAIIESEYLFYLDSQCIVSFMDLLEGEEGEEFRWLFGFSSIDRLLNDFGFNLKDKTNLLNTMQISYVQEFNMDKYLRYQLDNKYRIYRDKIISFLESSHDGDSELELIWKLLDTRSEKTTEIINSIKLKLSSEEIFLLLRSWIHMNLNRLFRTKQREHELVIYYLLHKHYKSEDGRQRSTSKNQNQKSY